MMMFGKTNRKKTGSETKPLVTTTHKKHEGFEFHGFFTKCLNEENMDFFDFFIVGINFITSIYLAIGPWFKVYVDTVFHECTLSRGTIVNPLISGLCDFKSFSDIPGDGSKWGTLMGLTIGYFLLSSALLALDLYHLYHTRSFHGRSNCHEYTTLGGVFVLLIGLAWLLGTLKGVDKPISNKSFSFWCAVVSITAVSIRIAWLVERWYLATRHNEKVTPV